MAKKNMDILSEIVGDAYGERVNKLSVLCAALDFISKGTRYREDVIDIIKGCYPDYFKDIEGPIDICYENLKKQNNV